MADRAAAQNAVKNAINDALIAASVNPQNSLTPDDVTKTTQAVNTEIKPIIDHLTNNEPWYQSRTALGAIVAFIVAALAAFGMAGTESIDQKQVVDLLITVGAVIAGALPLWSRYFASKPLGK